MESCTLCEHWSAHKAHRLGLVTAVVPALKVDGRFIPNPLVVTDRWIDDAAASSTASSRQGAERDAGKAAARRAATVDLAPLDAAVERARLQARQHDARAA